MAPPESESDADGTEDPAGDPAPAVEPLQAAAHS